MRTVFVHNYVRNYIIWWATTVVLLLLDPINPLLDQLFPRCLSMSPQVLERPLGYSVESISAIYDK